MRAASRSLSRGLRPLRPTRVLRAAAGVASPDGHQYPDPFQQATSLKDLSRTMSHPAIHSAVQKEPRVLADALAALARFPPVLSVDLVQVAAIALALLSAADPAAVAVCPEAVAALVAVLPHFAALPSETFEEWRSIFSQVHTFRADPVAAMMAAASSSPAAAVAFVQSYLMLVPPYPVADGAPSSSNSPPSSSASPHASPSSSIPGDAHPESSSEYLSPHLAAAFPTRASLNDPAATGTSVPASSPASSHSTSFAAQRLFAALIGLLTQRSRHPTSNGAGADHTSTHASTSTSNAVGEEEGGTDSAAAARAVARERLVSTRLVLDELTVRQLAVVARMASLVRWEDSKLNDGAFPLAVAGYLSRHADDAVLAAASDAQHAAALAEILEQTIRVDRTSAAREGRRRGGPRFAGGGDIEGADGVSEGVGGAEGGVSPEAAAAASLRDELPGLYSHAVSSALPTFAEWRSLPPFIRAFARFAAVADAEAASLASKGTTRDGSVASAEAIAASERCGRLRSAADEVLQAIADGIVALDAEELLDSTAEAHDMSASAIGQETDPENQRLQRRRVLESDTSVATAAAVAGAIDALPSTYAAAAYGWFAAFFASHSSSLLHRLPYATLLHAATLLGRCIRIRAAPLSSTADQLLSVLTQIAATMATSESLVVHEAAILRLGRAVAAAVAVVGPSGVSATAFSLMDAIVYRYTLHEAGLRVVVRAKMAFSAAGAAVGISIGAAVAEERMRRVIRALRGTPTVSAAEEAVLWLGLLSETSSAAPSPRDVEGEGSGGASGVGREAPDASASSPATLSTTTTTSASQARPPATSATDLLAPPLSKAPTRRSTTASSSPHPSTLSAMADRSPVRPSQSASAAEHHTPPRGQSYAEWLCDAPPPPSACSRLPSSPLPSASSSTIRSKTETGKAGSPASTPSLPPTALSPPSAIPSRGGWKLTKPPPAACSTAATVQELLESLIGAVDGCYAASASLTAPSSFASKGDADPPTHLSPSTHTPFSSASHPSPSSSASALSRTSPSTSIPTPTVLSPTSFLAHLLHTLSDVPPAATASLAPLISATAAACRRAPKAAAAALVGVCDIFHLTILRQSVGTTAFAVQLRDYLDYAVRVAAQESHQRLIRRSSLSDAAAHAPSASSYSPADGGVGVPAALYYVPPSLHPFVTILPPALAVSVASAVQHTISSPVPATVTDEPEPVPNDTPLPRLRTLALFEYTNAALPMEVAERAAGRALAAIDSVVHIEFPIEGVVRPLAALVVQVGRVLGDALEFDVQSGGALAVDVSASGGDGEGEASAGGVPAAGVVRHPKAPVLNWSFVDVTDPSSWPNVLRLMRVLFATVVTRAEALVRMDSHTAPLEGQHAGSGVGMEGGRGGGSDTHASDANSSWEEYLTPHTDGSGGVAGGADGRAGATDPTPAIHGATVAVGYSNVHIAPSVAAIARAVSSVAHGVLLEAQQRVAGGDAVGGEGDAKSGGVAVKMCRAVDAVTVEVMRAVSGDYKGIHPPQGVGVDSAQREEGGQRFAEAV